MMPDYTPILVSGAPRSGTTFLGRMLGLPRHITYLDEPLNPDGGIMGVDKPFIYIGQNHPKLAARFDAMMYELMIGQAYFKSSTLRTPSASTIKRIGRQLFSSRTNFQYKLDSRNPSKSRFLIKDPTACFAAQYFHQKIGMKVVVCLRHPAATIASYKRLDWHYSLQDLVNQDDLMKDHLSEVLGKVNLTSLTAVQQWAYFWLSIYTVLDHYLEQNTQMLMVRHEDLSLSPVRHISRLYAELGLDFSPAIERTVLAHTQAGNPVSAPNNVPHALKRDSAKAVHAWRNILSEDEIREIKRITLPLAEKYYPLSEW